MRYWQQHARRCANADSHGCVLNITEAYIWRLYTIARFEQTDDGVYVELEAMALSRDIPVAVRWLVTPIVRNISKSSLLTSLHQMEEAVRSTAVAVKTKQSTIARNGNDTMIASRMK